MTRNVKDSIMPSVCNCIGKSVFVLWLCVWRMGVRWYLYVNSVCLLFM